MSYISNITSSQIPQLTTGQIRNLSTDEVGALTTAQIAALTSAQIGALESRDFMQLSSDQIGAFDGSMFSDGLLVYGDKSSLLSPTQVQGLTTTQLSSVSYTHLTLPTICSV